MPHTFMTPNELQPIDEDRLRTWCEAAKQGDEESLEQLLCICHHRLLGLARRKVGVDWRGKIDPEDIVQEAFAEIAQAIKGFTYAGEDSFFRWSAKIVDHTFVDAVRRLRRAKRDVTREVAQRGSDRSRYQSLLDQCAGDWKTASAVVRQQDALAAMASCIAAMPENYRTLLTRIYLEEQAIADVARDMGKSDDAIRRMVGRAVEEVGHRMGRLSRYMSQF